MKTVISVFASVSLIGLCGCAHYQFLLVQPGQYAQVVGEQPIRIVYEPLQYQLARHDDRLILQIENPTANPVNLVGSKSYVVEPQGESRPVRGRAIAPHSRVRMSLPPKPPRITTYGFAGYWGPGPFWYGPYGYYPGYYPYGYAESYELITPYDWHWKKGDVRLHLSYSYQATTFEQEFVFSKQEVKK